MDILFSKFFLLCFWASLLFAPTGIASSAACMLNNCCWLFFTKAQGIVSFPSSKCGVSLNKANPLKWTFPQNCQTPKLWSLLNPGFSPLGSWEKRLVWVNLATQNRIWCIFSRHTIFISYLFHRGTAFSKPRVVELSWSHWENEMLHLLTGTNENGRPGRTTSVPLPAQTGHSASSLGSVSCWLMFPLCLSSFFD